MNRILQFKKLVMFFYWSLAADPENKKEEDAETSQEEGKLPSFTVLLHGSLKVEGMVALTQVAWVSRGNGRGI